MSSPPRKKSTGSYGMSKATYFRRLQERTAELLSAAEQTESHQLSTPDTDTLPSTSQPSPAIPEVLHEENDVCYSPDDGSNDEFDNTEFSFECQDEYFDTPALSEDEVIKNDKQTLLQWFIQNKITRSAANQLLAILPTFNSTTFSKLPKDIRTLVPRTHTLKPLQKIDGEYAYFGIANALKNVYKTYFDETKNSIELSINIDGLPLFKSSSHEFWPIIGSVDHYDVFIIALLYSKGKPKDFNEFLTDFVEEATELCNNGIDISNKRYSFAVKNLIADTPAKAAVLKIKGHTGYYSCPKCTAKGENVSGYICFNIVNAPLRNDQEFRTKSSIGHHLEGETKFADIPNFNLVDDVPLDYMHLVCLGATKRLLLAWIDGFSETKKIFNSNKITSISNKMEAQRGCSPEEFQRRPRSISDLARWKATEYRQFLLYYGPIILKDELPNDHYELFIFLHISLRILSSTDSITSENLAFTEELLNTFIQRSSRLFGPQFISSNIHALQHLTNDVRKFGVIDNFSAFKYENFLGKLKSSIRSGNRPLQQAINRYYEMVLAGPVYQSTSFPTATTTPLLSRPEKSQDTNEQAFRSLQLGHFKFRSDRKNDRFFITTSDTYYKIEKIIASADDGQLSVLGRKFQLVHSLYDEPASSFIVDIALVGNLDSHLRKIPVEEISAKCYAAPYEVDVYSYGLAKMF